jgi:hypothetical protein
MFYFYNLTGKVLMRQVLHNYSSSRRPRRRLLNNFSAILGAESITQKEKQTGQAITCPANATA